MEGSSGWDQILSQCWKPQDAEAVESSPDYVLDRVFPNMQAAARRELLADSAKSSSSAGPKEAAAAAVEQRARAMRALRQQLKGSPSVLRDLQVGDPSHPDGKLHPAMWAALKQHGAKDVDALSSRSQQVERTLKLMGIVNVGMELAKTILLKSYPGKLYFSSQKNDVFVRCPHLDKDGRPIYKSNQQGLAPDSSYLAWHSGSFGGYWSAYADQEGMQAGQLVKWAPLPFDQGGRWVFLDGTEDVVKEVRLKGGRVSVMSPQPHSCRDRSGNASFGSYSEGSMSFTGSNFGGTSEGGRALTPASDDLFEERTGWHQTATSKESASAAPSSLEGPSPMGTPNKSYHFLSVQCHAEMVGEDGETAVKDFFADTFRELKGLPGALGLQVRKLLYQLERGAALLSGEEPEPKCQGDLQLLLSRLAERAKRMGGADLDSILSKELPGYPFELSFVQLMIINCRLIGISRLRHPSWPLTVIRLHDFVARAWRQSREEVARDGQGGSPSLKVVRYLDLVSKTVREQELPPKLPNHARFVFISDTHSWPVTLPELDGAGRGASGARPGEMALGGVLLPKGDVLLHGGDLLNEAVGLPNHVIEDSPLNLVCSKLIEELSNLSAMAVTRDEDGNQVMSTRDGGPLPGEEHKFKWVFFIGGNHDAPLHMLASLGKLRPQLGRSLVMLQTPAEFDHAIPLDRHVPTRVSSVASSLRVEGKVVQGSVRLCDGSSICEPDCRTDEGVVIAGSGLSMANNAWSANRAFQVQRSETSKLRWAAEQLVKQEPDIVMTHGPPKGYCDEGKGDAFLREALDSPDSSVKLHLFGHSHTDTLCSDDRKWTLHGCSYSGRCFVNGSSCSQLYLPIRLPIVFDLPMRPGPAREGL